MVKPKHEVSLRRKSGSALFQKRKFRRNKFTKISGEKTSNTYIESNSNTNSSTALLLAKSPVVQLIILFHHQLKNLKHTAQQEWKYRMNQVKTVRV